MITKLEDLSELKSLSALHLRDNKLEILDGFNENMISLQYINLRFKIFLKNWNSYKNNINLLINKLLRGNLVADYSEVKKLQVLPKLKALVLLGK